MRTAARPTWSAVRARADAEKGGYAAAIHEISMPYEVIWHIVSLFLLVLCTFVRPATFRRGQTTERGS